jgi:hypothetical protein
MNERDKPGLLGAGRTELAEFPLTDGLGWLRLRIGKFIKGGVYLLAGQPGIGKSTLAIRLALDLGRQGHKVLYILTEQSREELAQRARLIMTHWPSKDVDAALSLPSFRTYRRTSRAITFTSARSTCSGRCGRYRNQSSPICGKLFKRERFRDPFVFSSHPVALPWYGRRPST